MNDNRFFFVITLFGSFVALHAQESTQVPHMVAAALMANPTQIRSISSSELEEYNIVHPAGNFAAHGQGPQGPTGITGITGTINSLIYCNTDKANPIAVSNNASVPFSFVRGQNYSMSGSDTIIVPSDGVYLITYSASIASLGSQINGVSFDLSVNGSIASDIRTYNGSFILLTVFFENDQIKLVNSSGAQISDLYVIFSMVQLTNGLEGYSF